MLLLSIGWISSLLSIRGRGRLGYVLGDLLRFLSSSRKHITYDNIDKAFPDKSKIEKIKILIGSYRNLGITLAELLVYGKISKNELLNYIEIADYDGLKNLLNNSNGFLVVSGHFGNWELNALGLSTYFDLSISVVVKGLKNYVADKVINSYRTRFGNKMIPMDKAAREIIKTLREGRILALLADQSADPDKDVFVPFFGRLAVTYEAPAELALKLNVPLVFIYCVRQPDFRYKVEFEIIKTDDLDKSKESVYELTCRHVATLEALIRKYPEMWSWQHRRWKHVPKITNKNK